MRKMLLAFVLGIELATATASTVAAQATGPGGMMQGQGDAIVVAAWLVWLAVFVAILLGVNRGLKQTGSGPTSDREKVSDARGAERRPAA